MCFGSTPKYEPSPAPAATPAPASAPQPSPNPTAVEATQTQQERRRKIAAATRYGMMSTIKTSPLGVSGASSDLTSDTQGKKQKLGA